MGGDGVPGLFGDEVGVYGGGDANAGVGGAADCRPTITASRGVISPLQPDAGEVVIDDFERCDLAVDHRDAACCELLGFVVGRAAARCGGTGSDRSSAAGRAELGVWRVGRSRGHLLPDRGPPSRGSMGSAGRHIPQRSRTPGMSGSSSTNPVAHQQPASAKRAAVLECHDESVLCALGRGDVSDSDLRAVTADLPPPPRFEQRGRAHPVSTQKPMHGGRRALRGSPPSITKTDRRERASVSAPLRPATPPPTTTTSKRTAVCPVVSVMAAIAPMTIRTSTHDWQALLPTRHGGGWR